LYPRYLVQPKLRKNFLNFSAASIKPKCASGVNRRNIGKTLI
jgi:hypothetical protein